MSSKGKPLTRVSTHSEGENVVDDPFWTTMAACWLAGQGKEREQGTGGEEAEGDDPPDLFESTLAVNRCSVSC